MKRHEAIAALIEAAKQGDIGGARAALAEGIGPDDVAKGRKTALIHAVERNRMPLAQYLVSCGANLEYGTFDGKRPLHFAVAGERVEMVRFLLSAGANPASTDARGRTPTKYLPYFWGGPKANAIREMLANPERAEEILVAKIPRPKRRPRAEPIMTRVARAVRGFFGFGAAEPPTKKPGVAKARMRTGGEAIEEESRTSDGGTAATPRSRTSRKR